MKKLKQLLVGAALVALPFSGSMVSVAHADLTSNLDTVNDSAGLGGSGSTLTVTIGLVINAFLGILGVIFLVLTIFAGFTWMTAMGDEKKIAKAKNILISAVIGLVVLLSAYAISSFVIDQLSTATGTV